MSVMFLKSRQLGLKCFLTGAAWIGPAAVLGAWIFSTPVSDSLPASLREPFRPDSHTVVLYHFDEGQGRKPATPWAIRP